MALARLRLLASCPWILGVEAKLVKGMDSLAAMTKKLVTTLAKLVELLVTLIELHC